MAGDRHSARGFHYECALRCLWLLRLGGTQDRLAVADGEDAKILHTGGRAACRQGARCLVDEAYGGHIEGWRLTQTLDALPTTPICPLLEAFAC